MEPSTVLAIILCAILIPLVFLVTRKRPVIPGPSFLDYLPNRALHPLTSPENFGSVFLSLHRTYGSIFSLPLGPVRILVTANPRDVRQVLTSTSIFPRAPNVLAAFNAGMPGTIFTMPKDKHDATRRVLARNFNHQLLRELQPKMNVAMADLCAELEKRAGGEVVNLSEMTAVTAFRVMMNVAFAADMPMQERHEYYKVMEVFFDELLAEVVGYPMRGWMAPFGSRKRLNECRKRSEVFCHDFIERRLSETKQARDSRQPDLLDAFLQLDGVDVPTLLSFVMGFTTAGTHTTNQAIVWSMYETCCNPSAVAGIEKELKDRIGNRPWSEPITLDELKSMAYINKVWKETVRLHPIGPGVARIATQDVTLNGSGLEVRKGQQVFASFMWAQRDSKLWSRAEEFVPERWGFGEEKGEADGVPLGAYAPFSMGSLNCIGRFLADYEGPLMLAEMHRRFRFTLACEAEEVVSISCFVDTAKYSSKKDGTFDFGLPVRVEMRDAP